MGQVAGRLALRVGLKHADGEIRECQRLYCTVLCCACGEPRLGNSDIIYSLFEGLKDS
jgi:hypothetical protein